MRNKFSLINLNSLCTQGRDGLYVRKGLMVVSCRVCGFGFLAGFNWTVSDFGFVLFGFV